MAGLPPLPLLHGAVGPWDDVAIFGGIGIVLIAMLVLSVRAGRKRKAQRRGSRRRT